jgi:hypothetical protein
MQHVRSIAAGLLVLVASAAGADELPIVKETQAYWRGCTYKLKVLDDSIAGSQFEYPSGPPWQTNGKYQLVIQTESSSRLLCRVQPQTVEVSKAFEVPDLAIQISDAGLVVAYTRGAYHPWTGYLRVLDIKQLEPNTLATLRATDLYARFGQAAADYAPGKLSLTGLNIYTHSIEVMGGLVGNRIWGGGAEQNGSGTQFIASYLDFFGQSSQAPGIVIY